MSLYPWALTFTSASQCFFSHLHKRRPEGVGVGYFPFPTSFRFWLSSFPWGQMGNRRPWACFKMDMFPLLLPEAWGDFSLIFTVRASWGFLEVILTKLREPPKTGPPGVFNSQAGPVRFQQFVNYSLRFSSLSWVVERASWGTWGSLKLHVSNKFEPGHLWESVHFGSVTLPA